MKDCLLVYSEIDERLMPAALRMSEVEIPAEAAAKEEDPLIE